MYIKTLFLGLISLVFYSKSFTQDKYLNEIKKIKDVTIYEDSLFYVSFPSIIKNKNNELLIAFRRAPSRRVLGYKGPAHTDENSYLVSLRSTDGEHWTNEPELIYAHPFGGSQDPCLIQLKDGIILCTSYGWRQIEKEAQEKLKKPLLGTSFLFLGGYLMRSFDGGRTWSEAIYPISVPQQTYYTPFGNKIPAYNRGALFEAKDGRVLWIIAAHDTEKKTSNYLISSKDKGLTWQFEGEVASDNRVVFNEASVIETPKGDIVGFLRTANFGDQAVIARSKDGGKTFQWESTGFQGHPLNALQLPDGRTLLTYGYRHKPYGIRARILDAECTNYKMAKEFILRDDGMTTDLGYTWPVYLGDNKVLVVYYFNTEKSTNHIAGTIIEIE